MRYKHLKAPLEQCEKLSAELRKRHAEALDQTSLLRRLNKLIGRFERGTD